MAVVSFCNLEFMLEVSIFFCIRYVHVYCGRHMNFCSRVEKTSYIKGLRLNCYQAYKVCGFHCDNYVLCTELNENSILNSFNLIVTPLHALLWIIFHIIKIQGWKSSCKTHLQLKELTNMIPSIFLHC